MNLIAQIPEVLALDCPANQIRIPDQINVAVTDRIKRIVDTSAFRRLASIPQLGLVSLVYPGATHSRFEHSLGVYRNALLFARQLSYSSSFAELVQPNDCEALFLAALLHDVGHWPFCHPIEDLGLAGIPQHEDRATEMITSGEIGEVIRNHFDATPERVVQLLSNQGTSRVDNLLQSILSGPIDIDKMDYLYRDSLHAGVPYGKNFDAPRLIGSLTLSANQDKLAITSKGKTAAELMVFARYVMFSEVYWHHAVRSATAMFQRSFFEWHLKNEHQTDWLEWDENQWKLNLTRDPDSASRLIADGLFGPKRMLYKRLVGFSCHENETLYNRIAHTPYRQLVEFGQRLGQKITAEFGINVEPYELLIDAPPVGLEVQFDVDVLDQRTGRTQRLADISPVVNSLAKRQFDDFVKQIRVFVHPDKFAALSGLDFIALLDDIDQNPG